MKPLAQLITEKSLLNDATDLATLGSHFAEKRNERIISLATALPDVMANFPEEERLIILIDIVGFSQSTTREQVYRIYLFQKYLTAQLVNNRFAGAKKLKIAHFVPTGDGCYIIADACEPAVALEFLVALIGGFARVQTERAEPLALRASALIGSCVPFLDMAHHKNYIGDGMNEAARILSGGQHALEAQFRADAANRTDRDAKRYSQNSLYLGDSLASAAEHFADACAAIFRYPAVADKHGKTRNITVLQGVGR